MNTGLETGTGYLAQHFSRFLKDMEKGVDSRILELARLLSFAVNQGHVCLELSKLNQFTDELSQSLSDTSINEIIELLTQSELVGEKNETKPLILDKTRLYLNRYWEYEDRFIQKFQTLVSSEIQSDIENIDEIIQKYFPQQGDDPENKQAQAAKSVITKRLSIISGGPGTGKTYTAARILALLVELKQGDAPNVAICAPTGKAASRLKESLQEQFSKLNIEENLIKELSSKASTVHRLLGPIRNSVFFKFNKDNKLGHDIILIDEVSMLDIALISKLFDAIDPQKTRVILLGDADQLASVEAGTILGDIASIAESPQKENPALSEAFTRLTLSRRYTAGSGIDKLSKAVRVGDSQTALSIIQEDSEDLEILKNDSIEEFQIKIQKWMREIFKKWNQCQNAEEALEALSSFKILCAQKKGNFGIDSINAQVESSFEKQGIRANNALFYKGQPILITRNDYVLKLFNGDTGVIFPSEKDNKLYAWFKNAEGKLQQVSLFRLTSWQTCYAMTIHRSQGSEFEEVVVVLPEKESPLLSRELLYTGLSRAKKKVYLSAKEGIFKSCIEKQVIRFSGIRKKLI